MYPTVSAEIVRAEQAYRLEGFRRWSRRQVAGAEYAASDQPAVVQAEVSGGRARRHRHTSRPVLGR